ncbi:MAG: polyisoprenoid-binding protein YceI [Arenicella sp.]|jgi:polyisoprenoid-binding protein YceI
MKAFMNKNFLMRTFLMQVFLPFTIVVYLCSGIPSAHAELKSSHQSGTVAFSGQHAGMNFEGKFERWQATLILPPQSNPNITATFYMSSAKTGDSIYDSTLPEFDWFDVENHALGKFVSTKITIIEAGYQVLGDLTIKNITKPVNFILTDIDAKLTASFGINRLDYQIGLESDPDAEWVSKTISISMLIEK